MHLQLIEYGIFDHNIINCRKYDSEFVALFDKHKSLYKIVGKMQQKFEIPYNDTVAPLKIEIFIGYIHIQEIISATAAVAAAYIHHKTASQMILVYLY